MKSNSVGTKLNVNGKKVGGMNEIDGIEITADTIDVTDFDNETGYRDKLPGWKCDIRGIRRYEDLPENCRRYVEFIEKKIGFPITMVSNGPGREDIIYRKSKYSK